ncbi:MAG: phage tail protein [Acidobacteria bacterium]|jgi:phage tail-like protein|nr:phage tail protein [Acidobacteriota bacterium]
MKTNTLYNLLPRVYRREDIKKGYPLYAFMEVLGSVYESIEQGIDSLYDNWFIETCDEQRIPYIADLLGIKGLNVEKQFPGAWRALVANTIGYRRRKGTLASLANAVRDATGWQTTALEFVELLASTQSVKHLRPGKGATVNLRDKKALAALGTPFESTPHTASFHSFSHGYVPFPDPVENGQGKYNIPNIGIFLFRLRSYPITGGSARKIKENAYTFHPFGLDMPLYNSPQYKVDNNSVAKEQNLPVPLTRHLLQEQLANSRILKPAIRIFLRTSDMDSHKEIEPSRIRTCNLEHWHPPHDIRVDRRAEVAVDPETGRLLILGEKKPMSVIVDYSYGFSADIGGGPYSRGETIADTSAAPWLAYVSRAFAHQTADSQNTKNRFASLNSALAAWAENGKNGIIRIADSCTYKISETSHIETGTNDYLAIEAAEGMCPCLTGNIWLNGTCPGGRVDLNGLRVDGPIVLQGELHLTVAHSTVKGLAFNTIVNEDQTFNENQIHDLQVTVTHSIVGPIHLPETIRQLYVGDSIIDGRHINSAAIVAPTVILERTTVLGAADIKQLSAATDVIFTGPLNVQRTSEGYIRFSYLPEGSRVPVMEYKCIKGHLNISDLFTTVEYGRPGFAQLGSRCPKEIKVGAENESEIGAFNHLYQARRQACLKDALNQYFPYGLKPGVFYVN